MSALNPTIYLLSQDYVLYNHDEEKLGRAGQEFFGKSYGIGLLCEGSLWFPTNLRRPWKNDKNFQDYKDSHRPECSEIHITPVSQNTLRTFILRDIDTSGILTCFKPGSKGIYKYNEEPPGTGSLLIYHSNLRNNIQVKDIAFNVINMEDIQWTDGICKIETPYLGPRNILGGALFHRKIDIGNIEWKAVAVMVNNNNNWQLVRLPE